MDTNSIMELITESVTSEVFGIWFLIGAALVFFMQAGSRRLSAGSAALRTPEIS